MSERVETNPKDRAADPEQDHEVNETGPAGQSADPFSGEPVSGMPVGGPHDLGRKAHERAKEQRKHD